MKKTVLKRALVLLLSLMLILPTLVGCSGNGSIHPALTFDGITYVYGDEIDVDKLLEKYPEAIITGTSYSLTPEVSLVIRNVEGVNYVVGYFISGECNANINGISVGDAQKNYLNNFESSAVLSSDETGTNYILGFYVYNEKFISRNKFNQYLDAKRFEGTKAHEEYLASVCVSTALTDGNHIRSMCYGDYNAIYNGI